MELIDIVLYPSKLPCVAQDDGNNQAVPVPVSVSVPICVAQAFSQTK